MFQLKPWHQNKRLHCRWFVSSINRVRIGKKCAKETKKEEKDRKFGFRFSFWLFNC